jgi:hypothetical protein
MRYTEANPETIGGMSKINTTALSTYLKVRSGIHYRKSQPEESHVMVQAYNTGLTGAQVLQNTTAIPSQGDFSSTALGTDSSGAGLGRFSTAPGGEVAYCNGVDTVIWPGDEQRISGFYNYDPTGGFSYDFTSEVQNTLTTDFATVTSADGGLDSNVMLLLHLDNDATDDSPTTAHTPVPSNMTYSTSVKVFGTHSAVFNGSNAKITIPDDADFDFSSGTFTIDGKFMVDSLASVNPIFHQNVPITTVPFDSGSLEPSVGDVLEGNVGSPGGGGTVVRVGTLDVGTSWGASDAAGSVYLSGGVAGLANNEIVNNNTLGSPAGDDIFTVDGTVTLNDDEDHFHIHIETDGSIHAVYTQAGTGEVITCTTAAGTISVDTWYHIAVVENGDNWYIFVDGVLKGSVYDATSTRLSNMTSDIEIGYEVDGSLYFDGYMDEYRISNSARWTSNFDVPNIAYEASSTGAYFYLGSIRPIKGIKFYIGTANTATGTMYVQYWDGTKWVTTSSLVDGTASGGVPLAQTGTVTFGDTEAIAKVKYLNQTYVYWYKIYVDSCDTTTTIYNVTASASMQSIKDIWDGQLRECFSFQIYDNSKYYDNTLAVRHEDWVTDIVSTVANINGLTSGTDYIVAGFTEKQSGFVVTIIGLGNENAAVATISYWDGSDWASVGNIDDGTSEAGKSFSKSGVITWTPPSAEYRTTISKQYQLYYYKISWNNTVSSSTSKVYIDYFSGIPAQTEIKNFKFPLHAQDRLWLCSDQSGDKNSVIQSAYNTSVVFNGADTFRLYFGDETEITAGTSIYSQFGSALYDLMVICKNTETWIVTGSGPDNWSKYKASERIGCPAPLTMVQAHIDVDIIPGFNRYVAIWQATDGIYIFDGRTFFPIHKDIDDVFDKRESTSINRDKIGDSVGFFDNQNQEYHWCWASGTSTTLDKEYVFDLRRMKWYEVDRGTDLQFGMEVYDTSGNSYNYGFIDTGYMERLENGNTFDGTDITSTLQTGDIFIAGSPMLESTIRTSKLIMNGKATTSNSVSISHYGDGSTTATATRNYSPSGSTIKMPLHTEGLGPFTTHKFKFTMTTNDETIGFEPLLYSLAYKTIRIDKN